MLLDRDPAAVATAVARGAGTAWDGRSRSATCCSPSRRVRSCPRCSSCALRRRRSRTSRRCRCRCSARPLPTAAAATSLCGSHPMAGKETSGPEGADRASCSLGRPWALCPDATTDPAAVEAARPWRSRAERYRWSWRPTSTTPPSRWSATCRRSTASALAAVLLARAGGELPLAGPGLKDTTRIAASAPALWVEVLGANAPAVRAAGARAGRRAGPRGRGAARRSTAAPCRTCCERGGRGRALVPVKRGGHDARLRGRRRRPSRTAPVSWPACWSARPTRASTSRTSGSSTCPDGRAVSSSCSSPPDGADGARAALAAAGWDVLAH